MAINWDDMAKKAKSYDQRNNIKQRTQPSVVQRQTETAQPYKVETSVTPQPKAPTLSEKLNFQSRLPQPAHQKIWNMNTGTAIPERLNLIQSAVDSRAKTIPGKTNVPAEQVGGRKDELQAEIKRLSERNQVLGMARGSLPQIQLDEYNRNAEAIRAASDELKSLERAVTHSERDEYGWRLEDAKTAQKNTATELMGIGTRARVGNAETTRNALISATQKDFEARADVKGAKRDIERVEYVDKYHGRKYDDNFGGQFMASNTVGRLSQDQSMAWSKYLDNPSPENRKYAETIDQLIEQFRENNIATLDEDAQAKWISQSLAGYLPQLQDQLIHQGVGGLIGGGVGLLVGNPVAGAKAGAIAGSGKYSYDTMRGAAFRNLIELGVDEETARKAASDEAVISAAIEMADTAVDIATLGTGTLLNMLGKGGAKVAAKKGATSAIKKFAVALGKYGINILSEGVEEMLQEGVSIANENRLMAGEADSSLVAGSARTLWDDMILGKNAENRARVVESGVEGMKIGAMVGGATMAGTSLMNRTLAPNLQHTAQTPSTIAPSPQDIAAQPAQKPTSAQGVKFANLPTAQQNAVQGTIEPTADNKPTLRVKPVPVAQPTIFPENSLGSKITQQNQQTQQAPAPAITPDTTLPDPVNKVVLDRGKKGVDVLGKLQNAYARTVDSQTAIADRFSKDAKDKSGILASNSRNAGGIVNYIFNEGLATRADSGDVKVIGKPLAEVVGEIPKGQEQAFWDYMTQRQNIDRAREGKHLIPNYDSDMSAESVRRIEAANPNFKAIGDNVVNWIDAFMQEWGVGSGLVDAELYSELRSKYKSYFPAQREFDDIEIGLPGDVVNQFVDNKSPIKTATGSARDISNPVENIMNMVNRTVKSAKYNAVGQEIVRSIRKNPDGLSKYAEIIPASVGESSKAANVVTVLEGGKKVYLQVNDQMLLNALKGLPKTTVSVPVASDLVTGFKNVVTQKNPFFAVRNIMRDIPTGYLYGSEGNPIKYIGSTLKAGAEVIKGSDDYTRYKAAGGGASNFFNSKNVETEAKNLTKKPGIIKKAIGGIEALNDATETSSRLAEFKRVFEKTGDVQKALYAADSVTVNFARGGDITKAVDRNAVPYLNAGVQGLDKLVRSFSTPRKAMTMLARGGAMILAPQILTYLINRDDEDYKSLSNYMKDNYFLIPYGGGHRDNLVGNGKFIKIPKSRELGILFAALPERIMRASKGDEEAYKGLGMSFLTSVSPANPIEDNIFAPATLNLAKNKNFAGSTIVPEYMRRDGRSKHLQYDEKTSELTKAIAEYASKVGVELSPIEMDYLIKSYTGVIGEFLLPATTVGGSVGNVVKRQFTADPSFSNQNIVDFYDNLDKATTDSADNKILGKLAPEGADTDPLFDKRRGAMETASKRMSELSKISLRAGVNAMSEEDYATLAGYGIESGLDGLELQQALRQKRIEVASEANNLYRNSANDEVALDLYRLTSVGSFEFNDKSYSLTPKEYKRFSELAKTMTPKVIDEASKMSWYKSLDAKQKEKVTKDAINFVEDLAKREIVEGRGDEYTSENFEKQYKAYKAGVSPATYFAYKNAVKRERPEGGTPSQVQYSKAINSLSLSNVDKGKLWDIQAGGHTDKNPFTGTLATEWGVSAGEAISIMEAFNKIKDEMEDYESPGSGYGKGAVSASYFQDWLRGQGYTAKEIEIIVDTYVTWQMISAKPSKKSNAYVAANPRQKYE